MNTDALTASPRWARRWLYAAGIYNLVWGAIVIVFPNALFDLVGAERMRYPEIWQCVGMIVGVYGIGYLIAAHSAFCIPFAYLPIRARLENMNLTLEQAAADLYATPWLVFRRITLPLLRPGIIAGFMLAFVISLDDVVITEFVKSGGQDTLPTYMLGQLRRATTPEVNAIATVFLLFSVLLVTAFFFINRRKA